MKRDNIGLTIEELAALSPEDRAAIELYESMAPDPADDDEAFGDLPYDDIIDPQTGEPLRGRGV